MIYVGLVKFLFYHSHQILYNQENYYDTHLGSF